MTKALAKMRDPRGGKWGCRRRHYYGKQEGDVEVPDVVMTGLVWGLFMGVSSNLRYQVRPRHHSRHTQGGSTYY